MRQMPINTVDEQTIEGKYHFVFAGGSCGSFVKMIWRYYAGFVYKLEPTMLRFNKHTGDAHNWDYSHSHGCDIASIKKNYPDLKIVLIIFDIDDLPLITKLQYFKWNKNWLEKKLSLAKELYPKISERLSDPSKWQETWQEQLAQGYTNWLNCLDKHNADFTLDFKTVYGKSNNNLNQVISKYFGMKPLPEVDAFISDYHAVNHKLYGK